MRAPFLELQRAHAATRLEKDQPPPRLTGITWSSVVAVLPQYWQVDASRIITARRDTDSREVDGER